jgi:DNA-directed RNA polymerase specialized sigma24 family protein
VPRDVVALVSADDFVSAVRVYADRVNDLLRRRGVPALEAIEICETYALALLDAVVNAPETVVDLAGWWFGRALEVSGSTSDAAASVLVDEPVSVLAGTAGEGQVRAALATLPEPERTAVTLRDGYDLPPLAVEVALACDERAARSLTANGRLVLVAAYDSRPVPNLGGHSGRTTVDVGSLSGLADGSLHSARSAPLRRHLNSCAACEEMVDTLAKGRRLAAALPVVAMDDDARESMIDRVASRADAVLPSHDEVLRAVDADHDPGPAVSPVLAVVVLVLALAAGVAIAVVSRADTTPSPAPAPIRTTIAPVTPRFSVAPTPRPRHDRTAASVAPTAASSPSTRSRHRRTSAPSTTSATSSAPAASGPPRIVVHPHSARSGSPFTVDGRNFPPGTTVHVSYANGQSSATTAVRGSGRFTAQLVADALIPGHQTVTAADGSITATAPFDQRL